MTSSSETPVPSAFDLQQPISHRRGRPFAPHRVVRLKIWPEMRYFALDEIEHCARICALIALRPSVAYLVHKRVGLPLEIVMPVLADLHERGFLEVVPDGLPPDVRAGLNASDDPSPTSPSTATDHQQHLLPPDSSNWRQWARRLRG